MKLSHFVQKMKKNTLKDGLDAKKDAKRDAKSSFCCSVSLLKNLIYTCLYEQCTYVKVKERS